MLYRHIIHVSTCPCRSGALSRLVPSLSRGMGSTWLLGRRKWRYRIVLGATYVRKTIPVLMERRGPDMTLVIIPCSDLMTANFHYVLHTMVSYMFSHDFVFIIILSYISGRYIHRSSSSQSVLVGLLNSSETLTKSQLSLAVTALIGDTLFFRIRKVPPGRYHVDHLKLGYGALPAGPSPTYTNLVLLREMSSKEGETWLYAHQRLMPPIVAGVDGPEPSAKSWYCPHSLNSLTVGGMVNPERAADGCDCGGEAFSHGSGGTQSHSHAVIPFRDVHIWQLNDLSLHLFKGAIKSSPRTQHDRGHCVTVCCGATRLAGHVISQHSGQPVAAF